MTDKFLGLNIIVGPGEEMELERCLKSCQGPLFDEIVVTITSDDEKVKAVAEKYADKVPFFKWIQDFSAARNYSFNQSFSEYIFWLDADDVIKPDQYQILLDKKKDISKYWMILIDYVYHHDENDNPVVVLPRERIVKKCPEIKWNDPIHEYLNMDIPGDKITRWQAKIDHYRVKPFNPERNISLLAQEYQKESCSTRTKFYYGKELFDIGRYEEGVPVLENYINKGDGFVDNLCVACVKLSRYYYVNKKLEDAKNTALKGIRFNPSYAENFVMLGDIYVDQNDMATAKRYYEEALSKNLTGGMSQLVEYYEYLPLCRLALVAANDKEYDKALDYVNKAAKIKTNDPKLKELQSKIKEEMLKVDTDPILKDNSIDKLEKLVKELNLSMEIERNGNEYARIKLVEKKELNVVWLVPIPGQFDPAIRLRRINIDQKMRDLGFKSRLISGYYGRSQEDLIEEIGDANVVLVSQFSQYDLELMKKLKKKGIKLVRDHCEGMFDFPYEAECFNEADVVVCCSTKLEEMTQQHGFKHTRVIKDAIEERYPKEKLTYKDRYKKPKAVYMGGGGNSFLVDDVLRDTIEKAGYEVVLMTEWDNADIKWDIETWPDDFCSCDVSLCPQRVDQQPAKSNVKATTGMGLGMPVVASPLTSYKEVIKHGENGYLCETNEDWYEALMELKDPKKRKKIGQAGKNSVKEYTLKHITNQWVKLFEDLIQERVQLKEIKNVGKPQEKSLMDQIDIIVTSYNKVDYLRLTLSSVMLNTLHPYHIIVSDGGSGQETWDYLKTLKGITVLGKQGDRKTYSETCNAGIQASHSRFFVILNSDLVMSKGWLTNMVDKMTTIPRLAACGVLSNCDRGWLHDVPQRPDIPKYPMRLDKAGVELVPGMKMETIKPHLSELYSFMEESNKRNKDKFVPQKWVAGYATIYARSAIDEVGIFDTRFRNGCEDSDLCLRLEKSGFAMGQAIDSFVFHFGGVSRGGHQEEGREAYDKEDLENQDKIRIKWSKPKIVIWTGPGWEPWNKHKVDEGMAGSETWASYLAEAFVKKGFDVRVYNDLLHDDRDLPLMEPVFEGTKVIGHVTYRHHTHMEEDLQYDMIDFFISSRSVAPIRGRLHAVKRYVMIHDVWLSPDPGADLESWRVQGYAYLSDWHKNFLIQHHKNMPVDKMFLTANGVNFDLYKDVDKIEKENSAIYSSSPDRGLMQLLKMIPDIRKEVPDFKLYVAYGFYNWETAAKSRDDKVSMALIEKIKGLMDQPGVEYLDRVDKQTLANYQMKCKALLYSSWFCETFMIGCVEHGLSKNALLVTDLAGIQTTARGAAIMLAPEGLSRDGDYPEAYTKKFVEEAVKLFKDEDHRKKWAEKAYNKALEYSWDKIADGWIEQFKQ